MNIYPVILSGGLANSVTVEYAVGRTQSRSVGSSRSLGRVETFERRRHCFHALRGKPRGEAAALARLALNIESRLVAVQGVLHDRESEAGAAGMARALAIYPVEPLRQPRNVLLFDADARIFDGEFRAR